MSISLKSIAPAGATKRNRLLPLFVLALVGLADFLAFRHAPGLNIALLSASIGLVVVLGSRRDWSLSSTVYAVILLGILIVVTEHASAAAIALLLAALAMFSLERFSGAPKTWTDWPERLARLTALALDNAFGRIG